MLIDRAAAEKLGGVEIFPTSTTNTALEPPAAFPSSKKLRAGMETFKACFCTDAVELESFFFFFFADEIDSRKQDSSMIISAEGYIACFQNLNIIDINYY